MGWQAINAVILHAGNTIITPAGLFVYNPSPGVGNLIFSVAPAATTKDSFGNTVVGNGAVSYASGDTGQYAELTNAALLLQIPGAFAPGEVNAQAAGFTVMQSGSTSVADTAADVSVLSRGANAGLSLVALTCDRTQLNSSGVAIPTTDPSIATLPTDSNSGSTWVSGERNFMNTQWVANINSNFANIVATLRSAGIIL